MGSKSTPVYSFILALASEVVGNIGLYVTGGPPKYLESKFTGLYSELKANKFSIPLGKSAIFVTAFNPALGKKLAQESPSVS